MIEISTSSDNAARLTAVRRFLAGFPAATEVLVLGPSREAVDDLVRGVGSSLGGVRPPSPPPRSARSSATFGLYRFTLLGLAARLAAGELASRGLSHAPRPSAEAAAARAGFEALGERRRDHLA